MHDYLFTTEVVRFAFMFGVAVSMVLYERRHLTTGSIVVPGYIATFIAMPLTILATFLNAFISYWIVNKVLRKWFLLYGRTKFTVLASISILIQTLMLKLSPVGSWLWERDFKLFVGVGYVVPALIAHDMGRQGIKKTIGAVTLAGLIVAAPIGLALLLHMPGINDLAPLRGGFDSAVDVGWIPIAVLFSAAASWGVARNLDLRSGGFMGAAFIAIMLGDPWQVVLVICLSTATYLVVTRLLMNSMILFGRRKFSAMLLVSASLSWAMLWLGGEIFAIRVQSHMDLGSLALTPLIVPGLLANDAQRTKPRRVVAGVALATTFVLSMTWSIQSAVEHRHLDAGWRVLAFASGAVIFGKPAYVWARARLRRGADVPDAAPTLDPVRANVVPAIVEPNLGWSGYERWAALHRDAADAADRWLVAILGERPAFAVATSPTSERSPAQRNAETRALDKIREAAVRALDTRPRLHSTPPPLPVRQKPLPTRRRDTARRGEFDGVTVSIAESAAPNLLSVGRPDLPYLSPHQPHAPVVLPPGSTLPDAQISEHPDATERAHTASGARSPSTKNRDSAGQEGPFHVFPG